MTMRYNAQRPMQFIYFALIVIAALLIDGYLKSYFSKKGENLATHEDIDKLVDQMKAVTRTTEETKSEISDAVWDRQKRWELRRDLFLDAIRKTAAMSDALTLLFSVYSTEKINAQAGREPRTEKRLEAGAVWGKAAEEFDQAVLLLSVICEKETTQLLGRFAYMTREIGLQVTEGQPEVFTNRMKEWVTLRNEVTSAARRELLGEKSFKLTRTDIDSIPKVSTAPSSDRGR